ncbi:putative RNA-directed DNA polymerase from transposon BS, partial [Stegodyphus mimosarum]
MKTDVAYQCGRSCRRTRRSTRAEVTLAAPAPLELDTFPCSTHCRRSQFTVNTSRKHLKLYLMLVLKRILDISSYTTPVNRAFRTNWQAFAKALNNIQYTMPTVQSRNDIGSLVKAFTDNIQRAHKTAQEEIKEHKIVRSRELRDLIQKRNAARRQFQRSRNRADKTIFNRLCDAVKSRTNYYAQLRWTGYLETLSREDNSIWKAVKRHKKCHNNIPPLNGPSRIYYTETEKAECLADQLESQFRINNIQDSNTERLITNFHHTYMTSPHTNHTISVMPSEVYAYVKKLKNSKSPGLDTINNRMIKRFPVKIMFYLTKILNVILQWQHFPEIWKTAKITPILKAKRPASSPDSYRPISLLRVQTPTGP